MINSRRVRELPKGVQQSLAVSVQKDLNALGRYDGYASTNLGDHLKKLGIARRNLVTRDELREIVELIA